MFKNRVPLSNVLHTGRLFHLYREACLCGCGVLGVVWAECIGGVMDTDSDVCYTYHRSARTRQEAADSCEADGTQLVSIEVSRAQALT